MKILIIFFIAINLQLSAFSLARAASSVSFGVYPPKISIITPPNQTIKVPLKIVNGDSLNTYTFSSLAISADPYGTINLSSQPDEASSWLTIENKELSISQVKLNSGEEKNLNLEVKIPTNVLENDHYISLVVSSKNEDNSDTTFVRTITQVAIPIIISIKETNEPENLIIEEFSVPKIVFGSEVPVSLRLKNPGKFLVETVGTITETGFNNTKSQEIVPKAPILAGTSRYLQPYGYKFKAKSFGFTTITISLILEQSKNLTVSKNIFIVPYPLIIIVISLVTAFSLIFVNKIISRKTQKR